MRYTTKTEYGLICLTYMAHRYPDSTFITIKEITTDEHYSLPYIEKIFQCLRVAQIVQSHQGKQGGYELARHPKDIYLKEIIDALEGGSFDVFCSSPVREDIVCTHYGSCGVKPLWEKTKELLDNFYSSVTLETLAKEEAKAARVIASMANKG